MTGLRRRAVNAAMLGLTAFAAVSAVSVLLFILGYLLFKGGSSLSLAFFTELPRPVGEAGGGMANAIVGSGKLLLIALLTGVPVGFLAGVYVAEFASPTLAFALRYATDLLNGVPSIVVGIFTYTLVVLPMHHFSTLAGGLALGIGTDEDRGEMLGYVLGGVFAAFAQVSGLVTISEFYGFVFAGGGSGGDGCSSDAAIR